MFDLDNLAKTGDKQLDEIMQQFWEGVVDDAQQEKEETINFNLNKGN